MRRPPTLLLALFVTALVVFAVLWAVRRPSNRALPPGTSSSGFATPEDCLAAYQAAAKQGDGSAYLLCLSEPFRVQAQAQFPGNEELSRWLRSMSVDVKGWAQVGPTTTKEGEATLEIDEVRSHQTQRIRFRLKQTTTGWVIDEVETLQGGAVPFRYGSPVESPLGNGPTSPP